MTHSQDWNWKFSAKLETTLSSGCSDNTDTHIGCGKTTSIINQYKPH